MLDLLRDGGWSVGLGVGPVDEPLPAVSREASGTAFVLAREAVEQAKSRAATAPVAVRGEPASRAAEVEALLRLLAAVADRRTAPGWEAVDALARVGGTQKDVARALGVSEQAVSQRLRTALWPEEAAVRPVVARLLGELHEGRRWIGRRRRRDGPGDGRARGGRLGGRARRERPRRRPRDPVGAARGGALGRLRRSGACRPAPARGPCGPGGRARAPPPPPTTGPIGTEAVKALRGGTWIGILERFAITGCLLAGEPGGIAFVVAIKGLGRYPELREHPVASERFVIGTLASMCWAATLGVVANAVLAALR